MVWLLVEAIYRCFLDELTSVLKSPPEVESTTESVLPKR